MPTVAELSGPYENFMLGPRPASDVCAVCFNFTRGYELCYACDHNQPWLDAVVPISYSVAREQLHHALAHYKRMTGPVAQRLAVELAAVLWRFLEHHESCLARRTRVSSFPLVTTVPSGERARDADHRLRWMVGEMAGATRDRYERLLKRSDRPVDAHAFHAEKFIAIRRLDGAPVLLIDDTWTTGASAQSAAAALKKANSGPVAVVVIGRHLNREWHQNHRRLRGIGRPFDWGKCVLCASDGGPAADV